MEKIPIHATAVCWNGMGILVMGKTASGKSLTALSLIEQGASLIADDVTYLKKDKTQLFAYGDEKTKGYIEARGIGIVTGVETQENVRIDYAVKLVDKISERIPEKQQFIQYLGVNIPVFEVCKDEKYLITLIKIAGKIVSKELSLLSVDKNE